MNLSRSALAILESRYLQKQQGQVIETPEEMLMRVAENVATVDQDYGVDGQEVSSTKDRFYQLMHSRKFLPNSPTLINAGRPLQQLAACFVLPIEDSMESIFEAVKNAALIHKSGGGTGFSFSQLRPRNDIVLSTGGVASGPVSFMKVFNAATEAVKQGGVRRGANMAILRVDHPDIIEFINCKIDNKDLRNFNISVGITHQFMQALTQKKQYSLFNPRTQQAVSQISAQEVFDLIVERAWMNGEPGVIFIDRLEEGNPTPTVGVIESTNPCGEQPLLPYEACNLGSLNLSEFIAGKQIKWAELKEAIFTAVHFLDNVIDANNYPLPQIEKITKANRKIGLGVMGFADALLMLGFPYNSFKAVELAENIMLFINQQSKIASQKLAQTRGAFANYPQSIYREGPLLRNATTTTIAPTGSISIIAGCSSGIEPIFALAYQRNILENSQLFEVHPAFEQFLKDNDIYTVELMHQVVENGGARGFNLPGLDLPAEIENVFVTAHQIKPEWHVRTQAAFQKHTDNAVSKTVNFPHQATKEDVAQVFKLAYDSGCKGITIYRDRSRDHQVLTSLTRSSVELG